MADGPAGALDTPAAPDDALRVSFRERWAVALALEPALRRAFGEASAAGAATALRRPAAAVPALAKVKPGGSPEACLAQAVYYEARGEPADGQAAVAQVVLNRSRSGRFPSDLCGVVFEGAARPGCQFSFACDPRLGARGREAGAWRRAEAVAGEALAGAGRPELAAALNFHADYVNPRWASQLARAAVIGRHVFYASASARPASAAMAVPLGAWSFAPSAVPSPALSPIAAAAGA